MIRTNESIGDPLEFVAADQSILMGMSPRDGVSISGADFDISVRKPAANEPKKYGELHKQVSLFFGNLYMQHFKMVEGARGTYEYTWYPSPTAVNRLVESLGLTPGKDIFRFIHHDGNTIPASAYMQHLADGEYPQSTDGASKMFKLGREEDRALGVLLTPKSVKDIVVGKALNGGMRNHYHSGGKAGGLVGAFDGATARIGRASDRVLWPALQQGLDPIAALMQDGSYYMHYPELWPKLPKRYNASMHKMAEILLEHLELLQPKVAELQKRNMTS